MMIEGPCQDVLECEHAGVTVLLSLRSGRYLCLNESAAGIWKQVKEGADVERIAAGLAADYEVAAADARADAERVIDSLRSASILPLRMLKERSLVGPDGGGATGRRRRLSLLRAAGLLCLVRGCLLVLGLGRTLSVIRKLSREAPPSQDALAWAKDLASVVRRAAVIVPLRTQCLEQSLSLLFLTRRVGVPAELRLGVVPAPFMAHAWLELDATPVNDEAEFLRMFRAMAPAVVRAGAYVHVER
jgi:hypothetical protein